MADNIVAGLFGMTPESLNAQRQAALYDQAQQYAQQTPLQRAAAGMFSAGAGAGQIGAGMMGLQDPQMEQVRNQQSFLQGVDLSNSDSAFAASQKALQAGLTPLAAQLAAHATNLRKAETASQEQASQATLNQAKAIKDLQDPKGTNEYQNAVQMAIASGLQRDTPEWNKFIYSTMNNLLTDSQKDTPEVSNAKVIVSGQGISENDPGYKKALASTVQMLTKNKNLQVVPNMPVGNDQTQAAIVDTSTGEVKLLGKPNKLPAAIKITNQIPQAGDIEGIAQAIADGRMPPYAGISARSPQAVAVMKRVLEINPNYSAIAYNTAKMADAKFTSGPQGNAVRSIAVANAHLDTLNQLADAMQNGDVVAFNKLRNMWRTQTGSELPTNMDAAANIVGQEVVKGVVGSAATGEERKAAADAFANARSPAQIKGAVATVRTLLNGQISGLRNQYQAGTRKSDFNDRFGFQDNGVPVQSAQPTTTKTVNWKDLK